MRKIQAQGIHHITLMGADRQTSIDFWEGVMGMPFIFDQPNLEIIEALAAFIPLFCLKQRLQEIAVWVGLRSGLLGDHRLRADEADQQGGKR